MYCNVWMRIKYRQFRRFRTDGVSGIDRALMSDESSGGNGPLSSRS